jgi:hypothetical protein
MHRRRGGPVSTRRVGLSGSERKQGEVGGWAQFNGFETLKSQWFKQLRQCLGGEPHRFRRARHLLELHHGQPAGRLQDPHNFFECLPVGAVFDQGVYKRSKIDEVKIALTGGNGFSGLPIPAAGLQDGIDLQVEVNK